MDLSRLNHQLKPIVLLLLTVLTSAQTLGADQGRQISFVPVGYPGPPELDYGPKYHTLVTKDDKTVVTFFWGESSFNFNSDLQTINFWDISDEEIVFSKTYHGEIFADVRLTSQYIIVVLETHLALYDRQYQLVKEIPYSPKLSSTIRKGDIGVSPDGSYIFIDSLLWDDSLQQWFNMEEHITPQVPQHVLSSRFIASVNIGRCARITAYDTIDQFDKVCVPMPFLGLGDNDIWQMSFLDSDHLIVNYRRNRSCLFNLAQLKRLHCWKHRLVTVNGDANRGITTDEEGNWSIHQLNPKKTIASGNIGNKFKAEIIDGSFPLLAIVNEKAGELTVIDLLSGELLGKQVIAEFKSPAYLNTWMFINNVFSILTETGWQAYKIQVNHAN